MRRRLALLWTPLVIALALALPASTAAASPYSYKVLANYCYAEGNVYIKIKMIKPEGWFSADRFTMDAKAQHKNIGGSTWSNEYYYARQSTNVPNTYSKVTWTRWFSYDPSDHHWHRIVVKLRVWNGSTVIAQSTVRSVAC